MNTIWDFFNNLLGMAYAFKRQIHDQAVMDIVTKLRYLVGGYEILDPEKK